MSRHIRSTHDIRLKSESRRRRCQKLRLRALELYGGRCVCCGESEETFLVFDHVDGGGVNERRTSDRTRERSVFYKSLIDVPRTDLQVLCANCNMAKERPGGCPHQR